MAFTFNFTESDSVSKIYVFFRRIDRFNAASFDSRTENKPLCFVSMISDISLWGITWLIIARVLMKPVKCSACYEINRYDDVNETIEKSQSHPNKVDRFREELKTQEIKGSFSVLKMMTRDWYLTENNANWQRLYILRCCLLYMQCYLWMI